METECTAACAACPGDASCTGRIICEGVTRLMALVIEGKEALHLAGRQASADALIEQAVARLSSSAAGRQTLRRMDRAAARGGTACWAWAYQRLLCLFVPKIFGDVAILELGETDLARQLGEFLDESGIFFHGLAAQQALPFGQLQKRAFEAAFATCFRRVLLREIERARENGGADAYDLAVRVFTRLSTAFARRLWVARLELDLVKLKMDAYNTLAAMEETASVPDLTRAMAAIQAMQREEVA